MSKKGDDPKIEIKKKKGTSEKLVFGILYFSGIVIVLSLIYTFLYKEESTWPYILQAVERVCIAAVAFIIWKAKNENVPRILNNPDFNLEEYAKDIYSQVKDEFDDLGNYL